MTVTLLAAGDSLTDGRVAGASDRLVCPRQCQRPSASPQEGFRSWNEWVDYWDQETAALSWR